jgi:hypothetical protein
MGWERVYTISDFFDSPRGGVADFEGKPHAFQCRFSEADDDWTDIFDLMEIEPDLLATVLERWALWLRWQAAFARGDTTIKTHPVLPEDKTRWNDLNESIGDKLDIDKTRAKTMRAQFRKAELHTGDFEVSWTAL